MMRRLAATIAVAFTLATPLVAQRYALVVGQNSGGPTVDDLRYAEEDAGRFARLLVDIADVPHDAVRLLESPDSGAVVDAARQMALRVDSLVDPKQAMLFFYYSGHADARGLLLDSTHCSFDALKAALQQIEAGIRIAIFDACQSGVVVALKGGTRGEPFFFSEQRTTRGEIWIASASASERAQESATLKSSLFSFHFFTGLHGSADISADGRISVTEAYQYAYRKTLETSALTTGVLQHPVYRFNITGEGDIVFADLSRKRGGVAVDGTCKGTFLIVSRNYTDVFADFYKEAGRTSFVALAPGEYTIINARSGNDIGLFQFSVKGNATVRCGAGTFRAPLLPYQRAAAGR